MSSVSTLSAVFWILLLFVVIPGVIAALLIPLLRMRARRRPAPVAPENTPLEAALLSKREENGTYFFTFRDPNGFEFQVLGDRAAFDSLPEGKSGTLILFQNRIRSFE